MERYLVLPLVLLALLFAASGIATITRGWVLPMNRHRVYRVRLYGWGQLVAGFALCWQVVFGLVLSDIGIRQWGTLFGSALLLTGIILMGVSQRAGGHRR
ncbi:hypothetical protein ACIHCX_18670 [Streptomyces sp. NPDC052043]|uniref:hypothetical protein n=1 Tax=Streptomyces sp. NPDC052043 TaxID=3365684 RepID=UPI0037D77033